MVRRNGLGRNFLFLQGPHGPFFSALGNRLARTGARVWRVGFNAGDEFFWSDRKTYIPYRGRIDLWPETFQALVTQKSITDIVLYGDVRRVHAEAVKQARAAGLRIHVFEEGYLRPYWVTYERGGSNGNSRLMEMTVPRMRRVIRNPEADAPMPPANWGDMREHIFYGAVYHGFVMLMSRKYRHFAPHRAIPVRKEFLLYARRLLLMPFQALERRIATWRIRKGGFPYHLALLQLEHDASFQAHSPFSTMSDFLEVVIDGFAAGAPGHHHLVVKAHPLEDGRIPLRKILRKLAKARGIAERVHYVRGGKLAHLLDPAESAVTINSTAGQQVLWRGIPLRTFGEAVYAKPEFVSIKPLRDFFVGAEKPDRNAYIDFRRYLLETSQIPGGYYSMKGRRNLLPQVVEMLLAGQDPYDALENSHHA